MKRKKNTCSWNFWTVPASTIEAPRVIKGVVGSPAILLCDTNNTPNIETVIWKVNTSTIPFLSYAPKDDVIVPPNHDPRYSIVNKTHLAISSLNRTDSAAYECSITSLSYTSAIRYSVLLNVLRKYLSVPLKLNIIRGRCLRKTVIYDE